MSPLLNIFFGVANGKKFKIDIHTNMKNNNFSINKRNPVYHLNKENLFNELNQIVKLHKNRCLDEKEINSYVWGNDKMNNNQLINKILDIN